MLLPSDLYVIANINQLILQIIKHGLILVFGGAYHWANGKYALYCEGGIGASLNNFADSYTANMSTNSA
ncbi:hypothetical protein [Paenochrobactrum pullorum]|uniref:hypothetical protein n=1 Tax=Paenochrobactrum pullorum TaxID=1324351 RepID=UPI0035BC0D73